MIMKRPAEDSLNKFDGAKKPVFLTKAQREQIGFQLRREEKTNHASSFDCHGQRKDRDDRAASRNNARDRRERRRDRDRGTYDRCGHLERVENLEKEAIRREREEREKMLEVVGEQYLGSKKQDKRRVIMKPNDKRRFCFNWDNSEDTSFGDANALYEEQPHEAGLLFGRGFRAGIDRREQKKQLAANSNNDIRHWSEKKLNEMTDRDWRIFKEDFDISYKSNGSKIPHPMRNWNESGLSTELLKAVDRAGYKNPSPIQMAAIPLGLKQRDLIATAQTGSGKTAAFVLPMLSYVSRLKQLERLSPRLEDSDEAQGPYAVVLAPTRELAQQIESETIRFAHFLDIRVVCIFGGRDQRKEKQSTEVAKGCEVLIATPGRLLDCLESHYVVLNRCNYVILDEADRMIDMGFQPQVMGILDAMPSSNLKPVKNDNELDDNSNIYRTTNMFSATMPPAVERLARKYLRNPVVVNIGTAGQASRLIKQTVVWTEEKSKMSLLKKLLEYELKQGETAIVFVNRTENADKVSNDLEWENYQVTTLHGKMEPEERRASLEEFRSKRCPVLVATDVAGRGIDIPDVAHVINYDMPGNIQAYTHRIGRTGRAGKEGLATTFLTLDDKAVFYDLKQKLNDSKSHVPPELANHPASQSKPGTIVDRRPRSNGIVYAY